MIPVVNQSVFISGCCLRDARFIAALLCQHGPGDACQLVSKGRGQWPNPKCYDVGYSAAVGVKTNHQWLTHQDHTMA